MLIPQLTLSKFLPTLKKPPSHKSMNLVRDGQLGINTYIKYLGKESHLLFVIKETGLLESLSLTG